MQIQYALIDYVLAPQIKTYFEEFKNSRQAIAPLPFEFFGMRDWSSHLAARVSPRTWKTLGLHARCHPSGRKSLHHYGHGGPFLPSKPRQTRGDAVATRGLPYSLLGVSAGPLSQEQQLKKSVAELLDGMKPWQGDRRNVNNLAPDEAADAEAIYGWERYERLASIKKKYDPANMFRLNHNVIPAGQASSLRSRTRMRR